MENKIIIKKKVLNNGMKWENDKRELWVEGKKLKIKMGGDFPGGAVVKNPLANAGDAGSSPGLGRSHIQ